MALNQTPVGPEIDGRRRSKMTNIIFGSIPETCEFCGERIVMMVLTDHPRLSASMAGSSHVYVACPNCLIGLVTHSLSPQQYLRAKQAGGNTDRFWLHGDFYDDSGTALQPILPSRSPEASDRLAIHLAAGDCHREEPR